MSKRIKLDSSTTRVIFDKPSLFYSGIVHTMTNYEYSFLEIRHVGVESEDHRLLGIVTRRLILPLFVETFPAIVCDIILEYTSPNQLLYVATMTNSKNLLRVTKQSIYVEEFNAEYTKAHLQLTNSQSRFWGSLRHREIHTEERELFGIEMNLDKVKFSCRMPNSTLHQVFSNSYKVGHTKEVEHIFHQLLSESRISALSISFSANVCKLAIQNKDIQSWIYLHLTKGDNVMKLSSEGEEEQMDIIMTSPSGRDISMKCGAALLQQSLIPFTGYMRMCFISSRLDPFQVLMVPMYSNESAVIEFHIAP